MTPVFEEIKNDQVDEKGDQWPCLKKRESIFKLRRNYVVKAQPAFETQCERTEQCNDGERHDA